MELHNALDTTSISLDLNDKIQKVSNLVMTPGDGSFADQYLEITGSAAGKLTVTNLFWSPGVANGAHIKLSGGTLVLENGCSVSDTIVIKNATFINNGGWYGGPDANLELNPGAKVGGTGFLGWETSAADLVIPSGATITPGNSIGALGCWNLEMQSGSMYDWEVEDGTSSDLVDVRGLLDISAATENSITVNVSVIGGIEPWDINTLFYTANGTEGISGSTNSVFLSYEHGITGPEHPEIDVNNNMVVSGIIIPEPATLGLLALLGLAFLRRN